MIHEYLLQQAILLPARLFSFGLLDGPQVVGYQETAGSRGHGPLTISRASTSVTRLIRRIVDLAGAHTRGALYSSRRAPCKKPTGRGKSRHAWGGRVQCRFRSQPLRDGIYE
jgi:hypothetical protein